MQETEISLIEYIRAFILDCPFLADWRVNVDYLSEKMEYSIDPLPCDPIIQKYMDGGSKKQYQFAFTSKQEYDEDARINIENSGFYQRFEEWLQDQVEKNNLPEMTGKKQPYSVETLNSGYLYDAEGKRAMYRIECRLLYVQEV